MIQEGKWQVTNTNVLRNQLNTKKTEQAECNDIKQKKQRQQTESET